MFLMSKECPNHWPEDAKEEFQRLKDRIKYLTDELSIAKGEAIHVGCFYTPFQALYGRFVLKAHLA